MGERILRPNEMATTSAAVATVAPPLQEDPVEPVAVITLRPTRTKQRESKKVVWTEDTVDNENMNKKKSKCCCIYEKPYRFEESDSDDSDGECEHCYGHVERRRARTQPAPTTTDTQESTSEPDASITLRPTDPTPPQPPTS